MSNKDVIEFYDGDRFVGAVKSSMVPCVGTKISILQNTWEVVRITYALDNSDDYSDANMRANVDLRAVKLPLGVI